MKWILRRSVGLIMLGFALFTGVGQLQYELNPDPEGSSWPWAAVALFGWLAFLNLRSPKRLRRGPTHDEGP